MAKNTLLIWGGGGHALAVRDIVRAAGNYDRIVVMVDPGSVLDVRPSLIPEMAHANCTPAELLNSGISHAVVAIGDCQLREEKAAMLRRQGFTMARIVHPTAVISPDAEIGEGTVIGPMAMVGSFARVGSDVILNTGCIVEHECNVADGVHVGPGAKLAGRVSVGAGAWIGIGAVILDRRSIGSGAIVGAGAVVTRDIDERMMAYGVPARPIRRVDATHG